MSVRDKNDVEWQKTKADVHERDQNHCRLCAILTFKEKILFDQSHPTETHLDCAHVFPVSTHPLQVYNRDNVYLLCRAHHHRIDDYLSPVTGNSISMNRHYWWWWRVINKSTADYNKETDYEELVENQILPPKEN